MVGWVVFVSPSVFFPVGATVVLVLQGGGV